MQFKGADGDAKASEFKEKCRDFDFFARAS
jgi:hypothetical protein